MAEGFIAHLGLVLDRIEAERAEGHLQIGPEHLQPYGIVHGGVYAAIAETRVLVVDPATV